MVLGMARWAEFLSEKTDTEGVSEMVQQILPVIGSSPQILCLGLGRPSTDRTAQIQLAFMLLIAHDVNVNRSSSETWSALTMSHRLPRRWHLTPYGVKGTRQSWRRYLFEC